MTEEALAEKFAVLKPHLNEGQWRLLLGAEAADGQVRADPISVRRTAACP
jgi:hypothetical protein